MFLRKVKYNSGGSRNVLMQRNYMENIHISGLVHRSNKFDVLGYSNYRRKHSYLHKGGYSPKPCNLKYIPKVGLMCGGIKTSGSLNRPMGVFYGNGTSIFNTLVSSTDYLSYTFNKVGNLGSYKKNKSGDYRYTHYIKFATKVSSIFNSVDYSIIYRSSGGNFALFVGCYKHLRISIFKLPSGVKLRLPYWSLCLIGRTAGMFTKYRVFGSFKFCILKKKKRFSTRGVAMNPVDHPNGGRSKSKSPFFSKYNWIAKKGK